MKVTNIYKNKIIDTRAFIFGNTAIIQPFLKMCFRKDCFQNLKY